jgi:molecular chaperone DnaK
MPRRIGIDLGTSNSIVAIHENGAPRIIESRGGGRMTPSIVGFLPRGGRLVGQAARDQQVMNPTSTIYSIKRFMGRCRGEVERAERLVPYRLVGRPDQPVRVRVGRRTYTPPEISAIILGDLKASAEAHLGEPVEKAVVSVPAHFDDAQRQATREAGAIAGLEVERIINEPTAAAIAYGLERLMNKRIVVLDFGGGTLDLALLEIEDGAFRVRALHGNTHLGGDDFDHRIIDIVADDFRRREAIDLRHEPMALQRLKLAAEQAKIDLSSRHETTIDLPFIWLDERGPKHLEYVLTRESFEALASDLFEEMRECCRALLNGGGAAPSTIDEVVLVGGSTRIPKVQAIARDVFRRSRLDFPINPDEVVAAGAATLAGVLDGVVRNVALMDVTAHTLGIETVGGAVRPLLPKHTPVPASVTHVFTTPRDFQRTVPIRVLQGDGAHVEDNRTVSLFNFRGLHPARRGKTRIEVRLDIDPDGLLSVTATDRKSKRTSTRSVRGGAPLRRRQIDRMRRVTKRDVVVGSLGVTAQDRRNEAEQALRDVSGWIMHNQRVLPRRAVERLESVVQRLDARIRSGKIRAVRSALAKIRGIARAAGRTV